MGHLPSEPEILNFEDPHLAATVIAIEFRGIKVIVTKEKLLQLLAVEQDYLSDLLSDRSSPRGADVGSRSSDGVGHSSLSNRVTKILKSSAVNGNTLRPAHVQLLSDLIDAFDWRIPQHAGNRLPSMLRELLSRKGLTADLRKKIGTFMIRYETSRVSL